MSRESKLVELRAKTDLDLVILVQRELDRGLTLANLAATKESPLYRLAEEAQKTVKTWLPLISCLDRAERLELESKLRNLSAALEQLPSEEMMRAGPVSVA